MVMKKLILLTLIFLLLENIYSNNKYDSLIKKANNLYIGGNFSEAIKIYESIIKEGYISPYLYYNLGNAYFKLGKYGLAILNYEKGLLYAPNNENIKYNLEIANAQIIDKIDEVPEFFLKRWYTKFVNLLASDSWAIISVLLFASFVLFIILYHMLLKFKHKNIFLYFSIIFLAFSIISFINAGKRKNFITSKKYGIIIVPSVNVKSTPNEYGNDVFILHEGTKVEILESIGNWKNIKISDGNEGYLPSNTIEIIE